MKKAIVKLAFTIVLAIGAAKTFAALDRVIGRLEAGRGTIGCLTENYK